MDGSIAQSHDTEINSGAPSTGPLQGGSVCIYDTLEALRAEIVSDPADAEDTATFVVQARSPSLPSSNQLINIDDWQAQSQCAACLEQYSSVDLVVLKCQHSYCPDCLQCMYVGLFNVHETN